ncbi:MAG: hypothetical protein HY542_06795 [Deltaproteobacteria bacterium]|nr:hypothetical protein [Deltaproteobacteria bacterium]
MTSIKKTYSEQKDDESCIHAISSPNVDAIYRLLVDERVYLEDQTLNEKSLSQNFSDRVLASLNIAFREAVRIHSESLTLSEQAKILEKIQVLAAEAERFAHFAKGDPKATRYSKFTRKIADISRGYFHKKKEGGSTA